MTSASVSNRATTKAAELVRGGAINGQHHRQVRIWRGWRRAAVVLRERAQMRRVIVHRLASIRPVPYVTGEAGRVSPQVANYNHPEHPELEDFGHVMLSAENCTGYIRVDWFTPDGLPTWGDGRLFVVGTEGTIEVRKYLDIAGRPGADHLFLVDQKGVQHIDCSGVERPMGGNLCTTSCTRSRLCRRSTASMHRNWPCGRRRWRRGWGIWQSKQLYGFGC